MTDPAITDKDGKQVKIRLASIDCPVMGWSAIWTGCQEIYSQYGGR
jgi:hypothetical protein